MNISVHHDGIEPSLKSGPTRIALHALVCGLCLYFNSVAVAWVSVPCLNDRVSTGTKSLWLHQVLPLADGGAILLYDDLKTQTMCMQRLSAQGNANWKRSGLQLGPSINPRGFGATLTTAGNIIVVWSDGEVGTEQTTALAVSPDGKIAWQADGTQFGSGRYVTAVCADNAGGAYVLSEGYWDNVDHPSALQHLSASGQFLLPGQGIIPFNYELHVQMCPDSAGGIFLVQDHELYTMKHVTLDGQIDWEMTPPRAPGYGAYEPQIIADGSGGAFVAVGPYAERISQDGHSLWATPENPAGFVGVGRVYPLHFTTNWQRELTSDGAGGVIFVWLDGRMGDDPGTDALFAQRLRADGTKMWGEDGTFLCRNIIGGPLTPDGTGGAIIVGKSTGLHSYDIFTTIEDIYAQRIRGDGTLPWGTEPVEVCVAHGYRGFPYAAPDGNGGVLAAWVDSRRARAELYASRLLNSGKLDGTGRAPNLTGSWKRFDLSPVTSGTETDLWNLDATLTITNTGDRRAGSVPVALYHPFFYGISAAMNHTNPLGPGDSQDCSFHNIRFRLPVDEPLSLHLFFGLIDPNNRLREWAKQDNRILPP